MVITIVIDLLIIVGGILVIFMIVSKEYFIRDKVKFMKFLRFKKIRLGIVLLFYRKFIIKSSKKSIFVLFNDDLKKLVRKGGIREVFYFNYNVKFVLDIWLYSFFRLIFGIIWRYVF